MENKKQKNILSGVFEEKEVRRVWHNGQWYFVINDVVVVLAETPNANDYIKKMRQRDVELGKGWGQIVTPLAMKTKGGTQNLNCANLQGVFRIIQSIPSAKAEPFRLWLARVGNERIEEIQNPEIALNRSREYWKKMGRADKWIQQRMLGQETRNKLTDYWKSAEVKEGAEYAILTNIIHEEWSGLSVKSHKKLKSLKNQNIRDHMNEAELIFTALAELSTRQIAETEEVKGFENNKSPAHRGGKIASDARVALEEKTGRKVITGENYLPEKDIKKKLKGNIKKHIAKIEKQRPD